MRSNVECRRCGCGSIIGLRESCAKCVAAQRARLHAEGFGLGEAHGANYDNGELVDPHTGKVRGYHEVAMYTRLMARARERLAELVEQQRRHAVDAACKKLAGREPPRPLPPTPVPVSTPAIGEVVSWEVAKADMQARPEARYGCDRRESRQFLYAFKNDVPWLFWREGHDAGASYIDQAQPEAYNWTREA